MPKNNKALLFYIWLIITYFRLKVNNLKQISIQYLRRKGDDFMYRRIRDLREDADLNQTQVATHLGMSQTGYSKYETGENDIPTPILIKLARYYNTSVDYLLGETDQKQRYPQRRNP